jgi:hypothetical protein
VPQVVGEARVFNLSPGLERVADGKYSSLARLIDFLSREYKALFAISAGNIASPVGPPPTHYLTDDARILSPSESLLHCLSVR